MIKAFTFRLEEGIFAKLYASKEEPDLEKLERRELTEDVVLYENSLQGNDDEKILMTVKDGTIRLLETVRYSCNLIFDNAKFANEVQKQKVAFYYPVISELNKNTNKNLCGIEFSFVNYLGKSKITFGASGKELVFDVIPVKFDYEEDYVALTESLAEECSALLLDIQSPVSLDFEQNENPGTELEQFIFLRQFCYSENIQSLFESIKRNPDRLLQKEEVLKPFGQGAPSFKFFTDPFSCSRNWTKCDGTFMPSEIAVTEKHDSLDTSANRFIKFALNKFKDICSVILEKIDDPQREYYIEASLLANQIDEILESSLFDDVGELDVMPQNNQILQKREGYSQIFSAYSMIDLALRLSWNGKENIFAGQAKNVALLYEYWLFFVLRRIMLSIGASEESTDDKGKIKNIIESKDSLTINLKEGFASRQKFRLDKYHAKINLYYNRTFLPVEFSTTCYCGSYSRPFRPDYTLAIFPSHYSKEIDAIRNGDVSYIHFDAKYRIEDLTSIFGHQGTHILSDDFPFDGKSTPQEDEELNEEKISSVINTYNRGDLLKMHTYNDAIRRTIGSYVLYPGSSLNTATDSESGFHLYEEILPGVGAFAVRPGNIEKSQTVLGDFIFELIKHKSLNESRLSRLNYFGNSVLQEPVIEDLDLRLNKDNSERTKENNLTMIGFMRKPYLDFLQSHNFLESGGKPFYFYYYAIKDGFVYPRHKDINQAKYFRPWKGSAIPEKTVSLQNWKAEIISTELVSRQTLTERLQTEMQYVTGNHSAEYYYLVKLRFDKNVPELNDVPVYTDGNATLSPYSPKVVRIGADK